MSGSAFGKFYFYDCGGYGVFTLASERYQPADRGTRSDPRRFLKAKPKPFRDKRYEQHIRPILQSLSRRNGGEPITILDVGGYIGTFSIPLALGAGLDGIELDRIYAFEAGPTLDVLRINVEFNGLGNRIRVHDRVISDVDGYVIYAADSGSGIGGQVYTTINTDVQRVVASSTIDAFCRSEDISTPLFIKLDTQGHEPAILDASPETIARRNTVWLIDFLYWSAQTPIQGKPFYVWLLDHFAVFDTQDESVLEMNRETMETLVSRLTSYKDTTEYHRQWTDLLLVPKS